MRHIVIALFFMTTIFFIPWETAGESLDSNQVRVLAAETSNLLKNGLLSIESKELEQESVKTGMYPSVSVQGRIGLSYPGQGNDYGTAGLSSSLGVSLNQPIYQGGRYSIEKQTAAVDTLLTRIEQESLYLDLLLQSDTLFLDLLEKRAKKDAALLDFKAAEQRLTLAENRYEAGMISKTTFLKARADAAAANTALLQAEKNTILAESKLSSLLGMEVLPAIKTVDITQYNWIIDQLTSFDISDIEEASAVLIEAGIQHSPDIAKLNAAGTRTALDAELLTKQYAPSFSLSVSDTVSLDSQFKIFNNASASLSGSITLSRWDRNTNLTRADILVRQADLTSAETIRLYIQEVENLWYEVTALARSILSSITTEDYARELYNETLERFELSAATFSELTDAEANVSAARNQTITSSFTFLKALTSLSCSLGFADEGMVWEILINAGIIER